MTPHRTSIRTTLLAGLFMAASIASTNAQDETYKMEIGGMAGGSFYMGDANFSKPFKQTGPAGGLVWRYNFNPHMAVKADLAAGRIAGNTKNAGTAFPQGGQVGFKRAVCDLGAQFEYNFWGYSWAERYKGNRRFTPYVVGGLGFTFAPAPAEGVFTLNFPLGIGVKYKAGRRVNVGMEWTMRFSLSDQLDVTNKEGLQLNDPYQIKGSGLKNKDTYSFITVFITYDFFQKCKSCNPEM